MTQASVTTPRGRRWAAFAWLALILFETCAQVALKEGGAQLPAHGSGAAWLAAAIRNPWVLTGIIGYIGSFCAWIVLLNEMPLSAGFPLTGAVMLAVVLVSVLYFGETVSLWRMFGIGLVTTGVMVIGRGDP